MIPRKIHQIYLGEMPDALAVIAKRTRETNPGYQYRLWTAPDAEQFIRGEFGREVLAAYHRINPIYGAARADLLRYLIIHSQGGIYLDCKSEFAGPIEQYIKGDEGYIVGQWQGQFLRFSDHKELRHVEGGEYQNWHVIAEPSHPFLTATIARVLDNIRDARPWYSGRQGVLKVTGPIAYTLAIHPLLASARHVMIKSEDFGLRFSAPEYGGAGASHYSEQTLPVVRQGTIGNAVNRAVALLRGALRPN
jgi:mannosyltransferase OCH1-like enzyme